MAQVVPVLRCAAQESKTVALQFATIVTLEKARTFSRLGMARQVVEHDVEQVAYKGRWGAHVRQRCTWYAFRAIVAKGDLRC